MHMLEAVVYLYVIFSNPIIFKKKVRKIELSMCNCALLLFYIMCRIIVFITLYILF